MKMLWLKIKEFCFWLVMMICFIGLLLCNQYAGYRQAEKNILVSCVSNNEFVIEDIKFACVKCPKRNNNDKK